MNATVIGKWIRALEDHPDWQVRGNERFGVGAGAKYCAVGMLGWIYQQESGYDPFHPLLPDDPEREYYICSRDFDAWVGSGSLFATAQLMEKIIELNDDWNFTFKDIALFLRDRTPQAPATVDEDLYACV